MKQFVLVLASTLGGVAVILGAFGAHALKKVLSPEKLASFEVGVKYQIYHALLLLFIGVYFNFQNKIDTVIVYFITGGIILFSGSIYLLSTFKEFKFIGPITPIGGALLIMAWFLIAYKFATS